ncbi:hypothetical protein [Streptomyces antimycoticus]|uniref:hypothetical protein n=1 Tax=Streptomyces antimycoticus TaxID=68175 RepID=UPI003B97A250
MGALRVCGGELAVWTNQAHQLSLGGHTVIVPAAVEGLGGELGQPGRPRRGRGCLRTGHGPLAQLQRAEAGIRRLIKEGEEINFRAVARAAEVSLDFLYAHTDLRKRIETLRGQQRTADRPAPQAPSVDDGTVIHTLTSS